LIIGGAVPVLCGDSSNDDLVLCDLSQLAVSQLGERRGKFVVLCQRRGWQAKRKDGSGDEGDRARKWSS